MGWYGWLYGDARLCHNTCGLIIMLHQLMLSFLGKAMGFQVSQGFHYECVTMQGTPPGLPNGDIPTTTPCHVAWWLCPAFKRWEAMGGVAIGLAQHILKPKAGREKESFGPSTILYIHIHIMYCIYIYIYTHVCVCIPMNIYWLSLLLNVVHIPILVYSQYIPMFKG